MVISFNLISARCPEGCQEFITLLYGVFVFVDDELGQGSRDCLAFADFLLNRCRLPRFVDAFHEVFFYNAHIHDERLADDSSRAKDDD